MDPLTVTGLVVFAVVVGVLIGSVGVGGVLLVPALVMTGALTAHEATATTSWAFLFTGAVGTARYASSDTIDWPLARRLTLGAVPAALVGVWANGLLSGDVIVVILAAVTLLAGGHTLFTPAAGQGRSLGRVAAVGTGVVVGFGSALTGTGGPVLLVPALLGQGVASLSAVAASQVIQLPIVGMATVAYLPTGHVQLALGTGLGVAAAGGVLLGARLARRARPARLRTAVALACVGAGLLLLVRLALGT